MVLHASDVRDEVAGTTRIRGDVTLTACIGGSGCTHGGSGSSAFAEAFSIGGPNPTAANKINGLIQEDRIPSVRIRFVALPFLAESRPSGCRMPTSMMTGVSEVPGYGPVRRAGWTRTPASTGTGTVSTGPTRARNGMRPSAPMSPAPTSMEVGAATFTARRTATWKPAGGSICIPVPAVPPGTVWGTGCTPASSAASAPRK